MGEVGKEQSGKEDSDERLANDEILNSKTEHDDDESVMITEIISVKKKKILEGVPCSLGKKADRGRRDTDDIIVTDDPQVTFWTLKSMKIH